MRGCTNMNNELECRGTQQNRDLLLIHSEFTRECVAGRFLRWIVKCGFFRRNLGKVRMKMALSFSKGHSHSLLCFYKLLSQALVFIPDACFYPRCASSSQTLVFIPDACFYPRCASSSQTLVFIPDACFDPRCASSSQTLVFITDACF